MLFIVHSGQTGVERGAHDAASAAGFGIAGFMPMDQRDELGPIPPHVAERLTPSTQRGQRPPIKANIDIASAALLVVPDAARAEQFPAMLWICQRVRGRKIPLFCCDPRTSTDEVSAWALSLQQHAGSVRLLVTGLRATRWPEGAAVARRVIAGFAIALPEERVMFAARNAP